eukprot:TRINITY_DN5917_c0_g1_i1.p2 TRINITY_DN5917_c0_g1~~TRINITY_DN5917_c0_g1_i1.p2  ORF type:complete len:147 (-),score=29.96 TRINITY_DN5917_c0_g1_i1:117-557(-)
MFWLMGVHCGTAASSLPAVRAADGSFLLEGSTICRQQRGVWVAAFWGGPSASFSALPWHTTEIAVRIPAAAATAEFAQRIHQTGPGCAAVATSALTVWAVQVGVLSACAGLGPTAPFDIVIPVVADGTPSFCGDANEAAVVAFEQL